MESVEASSTAGKVIECRAAVVWEVGKPFQLETIQVEPPQSLEVRVRICFTSPCHTDVAYQHQNVINFPCIFGHEASGIVESVGHGVTEFRPGDHVIPNFMDNRSRFSKNGQPISHFMSTSSFSEYTVIHQHFLTKLTPSASLDNICVLGCGVTTGLGSALKIAKVTKGSTVAVFGLGAVGLAVVEGARIAGASRIIALDIKPAKLVLAKGFGATDFLNPKDIDKPIHEVIHEMTSGGVEYSFECVGDVNVMDSAIRSSHFVYGTTVIVGVAKEGSTLPLSPQSFILGRSLKSGCFGGYRSKSELANLIKQVCESKEFDIDLNKYITHRLPFSEINEACRLLNEGESLRCVLQMKT